ncbi:hypothetical protein Pmani_027142 [Petrolisthes manimaculis]|uniref:Uncharacterized protein n=1 Tax=Petrolisthes manimaculis TaxID=1843537 RepID=A0AAE1TX63_9EUCA|nr:hypothetical protein Pmani_027142 [Petrolisthes manimaculis]
MAKKKRDKNNTVHLKYGVNGNIFTISGTVEGGEVTVVSSSNDGEGECAGGSSTCVEGRQGQVKEEKGGGGGGEGQTLPFCTLLNPSPLQEEVADKKLCRIDFARPVL